MWAFASGLPADLGRAQNIVSDTVVLPGTGAGTRCRELMLRVARKHPSEWGGEWDVMSRQKPQKHTTNVEGRCHQTDLAGYYHHQTQSRPSYRLE